MKKQEPEHVVAAVAVPLDALQPAPWNPRTIKDERFQNLCRSIAADPEFLWRRPVLAQADGTIYAGNMRYRAAQQLGHETIPAIVEEVSDQLAKERAMRDNAQWGEWEEEDLVQLLEELKLSGSEVELLGFSEQELEKLLADASTAAGATETAFAYHEQFGVTVICQDAAEQERVYNVLREQGYECRVVVV
jgi:ParB-like chromosome segregation protein Spo0J